MKIEKDITKKKMTETVISVWSKIKDYDLVACDISVSMFRSNLIFCVGSNKEFARMLLTEHDYKLEGSGRAFYVYVTNKEGIRTNYILIQGNDWSAEDYGTIVHELHHFTHIYLQQHVGCSYGEGGEEFFAYFQGYHMELVVSALVELKKALKKSKKKSKK